MQGRFEVLKLPNSFEIPSNLKMIFLLFISIVKPGGDGSETKFQSHHENRPHEEWSVSMMHASGDNRSIIRNTIEQVMIRLNP